jgi:hypothetical protein
MMPRARGSGARINKRCSNLMVVLGEPTAKGKKSAPKAAKVTAKAKKAVKAEVTTK